MPRRRHEHERKALNGRISMFGLGAVQKAFDAELLSFGEDEMTARR